MNMDVFAAKVCAAVEKNLGEGVRTEIRKVRKNNNVLLYGLLIVSEGQTVIPTIYLESFLDAYKSGVPFEAVVCGVLSAYEEDKFKGNLDIGFFKSYETVKDRICFRLIGRKGNEEQIEKIPHRDFLDMAICFYYAYHDEEIGDGSILIHNSYVEMWETCTEELFRLAQENTPRIFPWRYSEMELIGNELIQNELIGEDDKMVTGSETSMKVLSNLKRTYGAACILYPGVLEKISGKGGKLYIIPSSIHETIILPYDEVYSVEELKKMIHEVNSLNLPPEEVLSDSLYYYDSALKEIVIA